MIFSATAMTACGNNTNDKDNANTKVSEDQNTEDNNTDNNAEDNQNAPEGNTDQNDAENPDANDNPDDNNSDSNIKDTDSENGDTNTDSENNDDKKDQDNDKTDSDSQAELIETGEQPDIKVNKKGRFNGRYSGNDGCIYEFTKKGRMTITSDTEVLEYIYQLDGDRLSMVTIDETLGIGRQITLLEDGTYLLDDTMGNQVILTYLED